EEIVRITPFLILLCATPVLAGTEGMPTMPLAKPLRTITVTGKEDFEAIRGFGKEASEVEMMNLMMIEGSGMEAMEMGGMKTGPESAVAAPAPSKAGNSPYEVFAHVSPGPPRVGANTLDLTVIDHSTGKPSSGLSLRAEV